MTAPGGELAPTAPSSVTAQPWTTLSHSLPIWRVPTEPTPSRLNAFILRSEALAALIAGVVVWLANGGSPLWLLPAIFAPDLSMVGYLHSNRAGALTYNVIHNWTVALATLGIGVWLGMGPLVLVGALLLAHVGMDRALGYGLKLSSDFRDTHLGRIGPKRSRAIEGTNA